MPMLDPTQFMGRQDVLGDELQNSMNQIAVEQSKAATAAARGTDQRGMTALAVQTELLAKQKAEQQTAAAMESMDYTALLHDLTKTGAAAIRKRDELAQSIAADKQVSIFDDPLQALINSFTLPWDEQKLRGVDTVVAETGNAIDYINQKMQQAAITYDKTKQTVTDASIADLTAATQANIDRMASEANVKVLQTEADKVKVAMQMDATGLEAWSKKRADERAEQSHQRQMAVFNLQLEKMQDEKMREGAELNFIRLAVTADGGVFDQNLWKIRTKSDPMYRELMERGMALSVAKPGESPPIGYNPVDRMNYRSVLNLPPTSAANMKLQELEAQAIEEARKTGAEKGIKDKEALKGLANDLFKARVLELQRNIDDKDETNPFHSPSWKTLNEQSYLKTNPLWVKYVAPQLSDSLAEQTFKPKRLIEILKEAMIKDGVSVRQASELLNLSATAGAVINTNSNQLERNFAFKQTEYGYKAPAIDGLIVSRPLVEGTMLGNQMLDGLGSTTKGLAMKGANPKATTFNLMDRNQTDYLMMRELLYGIQVIKTPWSK